MSGIVFFKTRHLDEMVLFYMERIGCELWLDQGDCKILKHGNMLIGFHQQPSADLGGLITFFYESAGEVDAVFRTLDKMAVQQPAHNEKYRIYHFFIKDPEGRFVEFQAFDHPIPPI